MKNNLSSAVTHLAYPILLFATLLVVVLAEAGQWDLQRAMWAYLLGLLGVLILLERRFPLSLRWQMTGTTFLRDLKYLAASGIAIGLVRGGSGMLAIWLAGRYSGPLSDAPWWVAVTVFLVVFEFFQYWYHRMSHEGPGAAGRFLWKTHVAHHLPDRVYVVMHGVFHPFNAIVNASIIQVAMLGLGLSPLAAFAAILIIDLQTMISHFNVDIRAGFFNYVFIGTESHRYHHSASESEAGNFGAVLAIWDLVFGTLLHRPGRTPAALGVEGTGRYPASVQFWQVMALPFRGRQREATEKALT